ncbi:hypothetical protein L209DRAFT_753075 [Thermothelomyces heterothallicus CBS 203.75]
MLEPKWPIITGDKNTKKRQTNSRTITSYAAVYCLFCLFSPVADRRCQSGNSDVVPVKVQCVDYGKKERTGQCYVPRASRQEPTLPNNSGKNAKQLVETPL